MLLLRGCDCVCCTKEGVFYMCITIRNPDDAFDTVWIWSNLRMNHLFLPLFANYYVYLYRKTETIRRSNVAYLPEQIRINKHK